MSLFLVFYYLVIGIVLFRLAVYAGRHIFRFHEIMEVFRRKYMKYLSRK